MKSRLGWLAIAVLALGAGAALWWWGRPPPQVTEPTISGAALYAAPLRDASGQPQSLGQFQGKTLVLNFWATWCAPCREEMPAFDRLHRRWKDRGVAFVGISDEAPEALERFGSELGIGYPLWSGGDGAFELSRRLGNRMEVLPFTVLIDPSGKVLKAKVGPYTEAELDNLLKRTTAISG